MRSLNYLPGIDGLRAVAILAVVLFHAGFEAFSGGFVGVDIFFVISGFLISSQIRNELLSEGRFRFLEFYGRRIRRLFPALALVLAATLAVSYFTVTPQEIPLVIKSAAAVLTIHSNNYFMAHTGGYFDGATDVMPLLHTWSLSVEEQVYVGWPLLLVMLSRLDRRSGRSLTPVALGLLLLLSLGACIWQTEINAHRSFFLTPFRLWEFAMGATVGELDRTLRSRSIHLPASMLRALVMTGLALQLAAIFGFDASTPFPGYTALLPCLGTAMVIVALTQGATGGFAISLLTSSPARYLGMLSYAWYLWHWPLLALRRAYALGARDLWLDSAWMLVALLLAHLTYRFIETPVRQRRLALFRSTRGTYAFAGVLLFVLTAFGHTLLVRGRELIKETEARLGDINAPRTAYSKCGATSEGLYPADKCIIGSFDRPLTLVWGDSHAEQILPALDAQPIENTSYLIRHQSACPPLLGANTLSLDTGKEDAECIRFRRLVTTEIEEGRYPITKVILLARWNFYLGLPVPEPGNFRPMLLCQPNDIHCAKRNSIEAQQNVLAQALRHTFAFFKERGIEVTLVTPIPEFPFSVPGCLLRHQTSECNLPRTIVEGRRKLFMDALHSVADDNTNVRLIDSLRAFCDEKECKSSIDGKATYRDSNHLNASGSRHLLKTMIFQ